MNIHDLLDKSRGPLPGSVANNRNFVIQYMRSHGFEVKEDAQSEYPEKRTYYLRDELVGWSYDTVMYLQPVMPSLLKMGILAERGKTEIPFGLPSLEMHKRLRETVNELKNSSESYDELIKRYRAKQIRSYFDRKKDEAERLDRVLEYRKFLDGSSV
jgi:hypothetical protein